VGLDTLEITDKLVLFLRDTIVVHAMVVALLPHPHILFLGLLGRALEPIHLQLQKLGAVDQLLVLGVQVGHGARVLGLQLARLQILVPFVLERVQRLDQIELDEEVPDEVIDRFRLCGYFGSRYAHKL